MVIKKITSIILAASTFATFALAGATVEASTEDPTIKHVGKTTQQDGILTAYNYNVPSKKNSKPRLGSNWAQAASAEARRTST